MNVLTAVCAFFTSASTLEVLPIENDKKPMVNYNVHFR